MTRRSDIILTVDKIKTAKKLVAQQNEFIRLAHSIGYKPVHGEAALQRFRDQLARYREDLKRLTQRHSKLSA
jgi:hypothetical protein